MRNMYRRTERINEQDVPESQHTIFIRGLPGNVTTSEIREFFEDSFGSCTFDFIKLSKDREKLHVAVRFVSKTAARECMEKYRDGELFGHTVQLTWFRDIRRYLNHLSKQGINPPQRRRFDDDRRRGGFNGRRNWGKSRSRSISKSPIRRSRSPSRSRSRSASSQHSTVEPSDANADTTKKVETEPNVVPISFSPEPVRKSKKSKKERRKRRRHSASYSRSPSPRDHERGSDRDEDSFASHPPQLGGGGADAVSDMDTSDGELQNSERAFLNNNNGHGGQGAQANVPGVTIPPPKKLQIADLRSSTASLLQNTSFTVDLESNNLPRPNIRKDYFSKIAQIADNVEHDSHKGVFLPPNDGDPSDNTNRPKMVHIKQELVSKQIEQERASSLSHRQQPSRHTDYDDSEASGHQSGYDLVTAVGPRYVIRNQTPPLPPALAQVEVERPVTAAAAVPIPSFNGAMSDFKTIQRSILQDVRYKAQETPEKEKVGNFRLSSLSTQKSLDEIRHEKMARLSSDLQDKVERKKVQLELSYRHDCETFGLMTRKLIGKDRTLEDRLRLALLEIMKDLETEAMKTLDEYIDQMIFLSV